MLTKAEQEARIAEAEQTRIAEQARAAAEQAAAERTRIARLAAVRETVVANIHAEKNSNPFMAHAMIHAQQNPSLAAIFEQKITQSGGDHVVAKAAITKFVLEDASEQAVQIRTQIIEEKMRTNSPDAIKLINTNVHTRNAALNSAAKRGVF